VFETDAVVSVFLFELTQLNHKQNGVKTIKKQRNNLQFIFLTPYTDFYYNIKPLAKRPLPNKGSGFKLETWKIIIIM
jgi:hypothetical protein